MKKYNRQEVVEMFGEEVISKLESMNCEPTNTVMEDGTTEYMVSARVEDETYDYVEAYYYTTEEQEAEAAEADDWGVIDWKVDHYRIG